MPKFSIHRPKRGMRGLVVIGMILVIVAAVSVSVQMIGSLNSGQVQYARADELPGSDVADPEAVRSITAEVGNQGCQADEWQFVITQLTGGDPPDTIRVTWDNGAIEDVPLSSVASRDAIYSTTSNLDAQVTRARARVYESWRGDFSVSHG